MMPSEDILNQFKAGYKAGYEKGVLDGVKGKMFEKFTLTQEIDIPEDIRNHIFQAGKDSMKEEIFDFIMKNLYNEQTCEKINEFFNKIK